MLFIRIHVVWFQYRYGIVYEPLRYPHSLRIGSKNSSHFFLNATREFRSRRGIVYPWKWIVCGIVRRLSSLCRPTTHVAFVTDLITKSLTCIIRIPHDEEEGVW